MRIEIDIRSLENPSFHQWLDRIIHKISDGWHLWEISQEYEISIFVESGWFNGRQWITELLKKSIFSNAWKSELHIRRIRVTANPVSEDELRPKDAARLAEQPLCILMENRVSDGNFLKRVVRELHPLSSCS